jgi:hypothetical protein
MVLTADGDEAVHSRPRVEPDAATLRAATLAGPDGDRSEALHSGLSSLRCEVAYGSAQRTVQLRLAYGGGSAMLHFPDAAVQIIYQDLETYPPELFISASNRHGSDFLGQRTSPRFDPTGLSPGDVVRAATLTHPDSGSTLGYSCSVQ